MKRVSACVGVLVMVGALAAQGAKEDPGKKVLQELVARSQMKVLETALQVYKIANKDYPEELKALTDAKMPLVKPESLLDPWKQPYQYDPAGKKNKGKKPDLWTVTPDKKTIGNWEEVKKPAKPGPTPGR